MATGGRAGGGRGRGTPEMQKAYEEYQRELTAIQKNRQSGAPAGLGSISSFSSFTSSEDRMSYASDSYSSKSGRGSVETPTSTITSPTDTDSDSPPVRSPPLVFSFGRGRRIFDSNISPFIPCSIKAGPLRPSENIIQNIENPAEEAEFDEDDFVVKFRQNNLGLSSKGRGRGHPAFLPIALSTNLYQEPVFDRPVRVGVGRGTSFGMEPQRAHSSSCSDIADDLKTLQKEVVVKRGINGKVIPVTCNYIRLGIRKQIGLFEYHVDFIPPVESRKASRAILRQSNDILGTVRNFDGAKLFLPFRLPNKCVELVGEHPFNPEEQVKTIIRFVKERKMGDAVHFYNILFHRIMEALGLVEMKRKYFDHRLVYELPQHKLDIWPGYITAVDEYEDGLMLMCDSAYRVLRTTNLYDVLRNFEISCRDRDYKAEYKNHILGQIVITKYNNLNYLVDDVDWEQSPLSTFTSNNGEISYVDYYQQRHGKIIKNLCPPLIVHRHRPKYYDPRLSVEKIIYLIPEFCFLTGLTEEITGNYRIMQDIDQFARLSPQNRNMHLRKFVENVKGDEISSRILSDWGLELEDGGVELDARQFAFSKIIMGGNREIDGSADFKREITSNPCLEPVTVQRWIVFSTRQDLEKAQTLSHLYVDVCRNLGINVTSKAELEIVNTSNPRRILDEYRKSITQNLHKNFQFFIVITPRQQDDLYGMLKRICMESLIASQVILSKTLGNQKSLRAIVANIALQVNCKLGGALWRIKIPLPEKIMFVGMDVYHDPKRKTDSVTGLVASVNLIYTKYFSTVVTQPCNQETINSLRNMFREALISFFQHSNCWPDRIIIFRDGVGDGQLEVTDNHEVEQVTGPIAELCQDQQTKFTFVVVQKRINTRIFAHKRGELINPPPGTVLDHTVTRRFLYDFFLVSQLVRQGTVTPTHYIVLRDNADTAPDLIQKLAYVTSFMYYNWSGSIRVPAVCQYAHKLAFLVGQHLKIQPSKELSTKLYYL